jgi:hypothetical protein
MITTETMHTTERNNANLVAENLDGSRDAFRQIVEQYQPPKTVAYFIKCISLKSG